MGKAMEMNRDLLQKLLESYADKYEFMNDAEHHEIFKWDAISHFQKYWDIDAGDFGKMFKKALDHAENLIDDNVMMPGKGIVYLCERSEEEMDQVRDAFERLTANDHSDYEKRQKKIDDFVDTINSMLEAAQCQEWKFRQNTRAAVMYLAFIDPDDNYMFKEAEVKAFLSYVRFSEKIGSGKSFNLKIYYAMCDMVLEALQEDNDLIDMVTAKLEAEAESSGNSGICDIDSENHILVYDFIYSAANYDFYDEIQARVNRQFLTPNLKGSEKNQQTDMLEMKKAALEMELAAHRAERAELRFPDLKNHMAVHKKFGKGEIFEQSEQYLRVRFSVGAKKFLLPGAIVQGFLKIEDQDVAGMLQRMDQLDKLIDKTSLEIKMLDLEINGI